MKYSENLKKEIKMMKVLTKKWVYLFLNYCMLNKNIYFRIDLKII